MREEYYEICIVRKYFLLKFLPFLFQNNKNVLRMRNKMRNKKNVRQKIY